MCNAMYNFVWCEPVKCPNYKNGKRVEDVTVYNTFGRMLPYYNYTTGKANYEGMIDLIYNVAELEPCKVEYPLKFNEACERPSEQIDLEHPYKDATYTLFTHGEELDKPCSCSTQTLMRSGCKCGGV